MKMGTAAIALFFFVFLSALSSQWQDTEPTWQPLIYGSLLMGYYGREGLYSLAELGLASRESLEGII